MIPVHINGKTEKDTATKYTSHGRVVENATDPPKASPGSG